MGFIYFALGCFLAFYIPGSLLLRRLPISRLQHTVWSIITGMALWGLQAWVLGYASLREATYLYLIACLLFWLRLKGYRALRLNVRSFRAEYLTIGIISLGVIAQLGTAFLFGLPTKNGMSLVSIMPPDHEWHAAVISQLVKHIPPAQPLMSGIPLQGYHFFGDMIIADFIRVFRIPLVTAAFQYFSMLLSLMFGLSVLAFARVVRLHFISERLLLFLVYFGADFIPFITLLSGNGFRLSMGALESGTSLLMNYPRAFAAVFMFSALGLLTVWWERKSHAITLSFATALIMAAAVMSKVNVGIMGVIGLIMLGAYAFWKKDYGKLPMMLLAAVLTGILYLPTNAQSGGLIYTGFWRVQDFIVQPELNLSRLELARRIFEEHHNTIRVMGYNLFFLGIYVIAIFGLKTVGLLQTRRTLRELPGYMHFMLLPGMAVCFVAGMFFIQTVGGANSFNFLSTVFIFGSVYAAITLGNIIRSTRVTAIQMFIVLAILVVSLPRAVYDSHRLFSAYFNATGPAVSESDMKMYRYLADTVPDSAVFLRGDYKLSYLAEKNVFIGEGDGLGVLHNLNARTEEREKIAETIYSSTDSAKIYRLLTDNAIGYVLVGTNTLLSSMSAMLQEIYRNGNTVVLRVRY